MKSLCYIGLLTISTFTWSLDTIKIKSKNKELVEKIFGGGFSIPDHEQRKIEQLFNDIDALTTSQSITVIEFLIPLLERQRISDLSQRKNRVVNFIINQQVKHLEHYKKKLTPSLQFFERLGLTFEKTFKRLNCYLRRLDSVQECWEASLADRILDYYIFEREMILLNYKNLLLFNVMTQKHHVPEILHFWSNREKFGELAHQVQALTPEVTVQFLMELFTLALQSFLMGGNGMYVQWLDKEQEHIFEGYQKQQSEIEANFEAYVNHLNAVKQNIATQIVDGFKAGLQKIVDERKKADDALTQEQIYLFKSINLSYPAIHVLSWPPVPYDQLFEASVMNTPKGHVWYNIYQQGDWEFDQQTGSFFQNELILFGTPFWLGEFMTLKKPGETSQEVITDPSRNGIFTEYISNEATYPISVECTILNCSYPFFVGIMFNRARWISADPERSWQYRLIGLYGTQTKPDDPSTRSIQLAFAQEVITTVDSKEKIISPLEQIATAKPSDDRIFLHSLAKKDIDTLAQDSITFVFDITTAPESASFTLSKKGQGPLFPQKTINNLYSTIALYGGIGFMSAGAQAEFKILKPEKLIFSSQEVEGKQ